MTRTKEVQIVVNGQLRQVPEGRSLLQLLAFLEVDPARVAVELNGAIVRRELWTETPIASGAALEIVQFVGGG
ncbi:MAG TPA: sulfur carrier protein ThiS [Bryobacteraceae bacterium]|nr:sulfur carrier protein ThiS [Bryobacteraceae bacterium]